MKKKQVIVSLFILLLASIASDTFARRWGWGYRPYYGYPYGGYYGYPYGGYYGYPYGGYPYYYDPISSAIGGFGGIVGAAITADERKKDRRERERARLEYERLKQERQRLEEERKKTKTWY